MIEPEPLQQVDRTYVLWRRRKLSYFSGCDYFRLSSNPGVQRALVLGLKRYGLNVAASRLTSGNHKVYAELEQRLAGFFKAQAALLVPSGYVANLAAAQALAGQFSHALIDEAAHPSLADAAAALNCPILRFGHRSTPKLLEAVTRCGEGCKPILLTDGMFSRDGSVAPLQEYLEVLPADAMLLVDDAHGAGIIGDNGRGSIEHAGVNRKRVIQTFTLSKAFGVYGGVVVGSRSLRDKIIARSQLFVGSTPLPLPLAAAAGQALSILAANENLRSRLISRTLYARSLLHKAGLAVPQHPGPIIALQPSHAAAVSKAKNTLFRGAIYPPFINYPGGPASGYFRFVISSEHTVAQLNNLADTLRRVSRFLTPLE